MDLEGTRVLDVGPLFFKLPDGFDGSLSDALRLLADYHEVDTVASNREYPKEEFSKAFIEERQRRWNSFVDAVREGKRVHGQMSTVRVTSGKAEVDREKPSTTVKQPSAIAEPIVIEGEHHDTKGIRR